ncbi:hypothetical protein ABVK25_002893 [Lepraria finkii]|uniref:Rhodopsin domain-containing protein n=1 Tax=Lepraria finkii TaxID=1340010 RepID=A0ABR4BK75_9LECA
MIVTMPTTTKSSRGIVLDAITWTFFSIALIFCFMRLYADIVILRFTRLDTYIATFTFLAIIVSQICTALSVHYGMGQHASTLDPPQTVLSIKWSWMAQILQLFANTTGKLAVITYLATIHGPSHPRSKLAFLWSLSSLQVASVIIIIAFILAQCSPLQKLWNEAIPGTCNGRIRNQNFAFFQGSLSAFTDICLAVYPMLIFWTLQMKNKTKILLCILFGFGLLAAVSSIIKTANLHRLEHTADITYDLAYLITWNAVDMYIVFIASSVPTLVPIFNRRSPKSAPSTYNSYKRRNAALDSNQGGDDAALTSFSVPPGRVNAYTSAARSNRANQVDGNGSAEEILGEMGRGDILMTTKINVTSDGKSGVTALP